MKRGTLIMQISLKKLFLVTLAVTTLVNPFVVSHVKAQDAFRIGVMPATDSVPILWAQEKGYFEEAGITVEVVPFTNGANRSAAMQTGELDADIEGLVEIINEAQMNPNAGKLISRTSDNFLLVQSANYQEDTSEELVIGGMLNSVIHYLTLKHFADYPGGFREEYIAEIPVRIQMLQQNELDFAILPEPVASSAAAQGLIKTAINVDEDVNGIMVHQAYLDENPDAIKAFLAAYDKAVEDLQDEANIQAAKELLVATFELPKTLLEFLEFPKFEPSALPSEEYVVNVQKWLSEEFDQDYTTPYKDLVYDVSAE